MGLQLFKEDSNITKAFDPPAWNDKTGFLNSTVQGNSGVIKLDFFPSARKRSNGGRCSTVRERGKHMSCIAMS